jgi:tetratricopeptide (TPR) repeat protein
MTPLIRILPALALAACASGPATPSLVADARKVSDLASTAYENGRHDDALAGYAAALEIHRSIDNPEGILRNLLNLAVVGESANRPSTTTEALAAIDRYTANLAATQPADLEKPAVRSLLVDIAAFRVRRALDAKQPDQAAAVLARLDAIPGGPSRDARGRIANLRARLAEQQGDFHAMATHANQAIAANRRTNDRAELADSHRLAGRAALATGDAPLAERSFTAALDLDRDLARPNCVAADLDGLAAAADLAGDSHKARLIRERTSTP